MEINTQLNSHKTISHPSMEVANADFHSKQKAAYSSPTPVNTDESTRDENVQFSELWPVIRAILLVWAVAVWALLVMMPGVQMISDITTAMTHLPHVFIGLGLIGAMFSAYSLRSDGHLLWFLGVLLLLAGWM